MEEKIVSCNISVVTKDESAIMPHSHCTSSILLGEIEHISISRGVRKNFWMYMLTNKNDWLCNVPHYRLRKLRHKLVSKHINRVKKCK